MLIHFVQEKRISKIYNTQEHQLNAQKHYFIKKESVISQSLSIGKVILNN